MEMGPYCVCNVGEGMIIAAHRLCAVGKCGTQLVMFDACSVHTLS